MAHMAMIKHGGLIIIVTFCLSQVLSLDKHTYLQFGESEQVQCPLITYENYSITDVDSAYWYKDAVATENLIISNFEGTIYEGPSFLSGKYFLTELFSIVVNNISSSDEGLFVCLLKPKEHGLQTATVNVTVYVPPDGRSPEVEECHMTESEDGCLIQLQPREEEYHLTCHVINARPAVILRWLRVFNDGSTEEVTNITYRVNGTLQNVSQIQELLFSTFATVTEVYHEETTLRCQATGIAMGDRNGAFRKVHITRLDMPTSSYATQPQVSTPSSKSDGVNFILIALCTITGILIVVIVAAICLVFKKISRRDSTYDRVAMADVINPDLKTGDNALRTCANQLKTYYETKLKTVITHRVFKGYIKKIKDVFDLQLFRETGDSKKSEKILRMKGQPGFRPNNPVKEPLKSQDDLMGILDKEGHVVLVGTAGSGKTTLTRKIACDWACQMAGSVLSRFKLVFVLGIRDIQFSQSSGLLDAIQRILPKETELSRANLRDLITKNQKDTLIVLDGLDEVSSQVLSSPPPNEDDFSIKDVISFNALMDCRVLVTTRPHKMNELDSTLYAVVETIGFSPANRDKYIGQFFSDKVEKGQALIQEVQSTAFIHTLAQSPIMLLLLCVIWDTHATLPQQLKGLYEQAVKTLVNFFIAKDTNVTREAINAVKDEIGRVAFEGLIDPDGERLVFHPDEFSESLDKALNIGFLYQESKADCTQLVEIVNFLHKSFQEFFAAHYLVTQAIEKIQSELLPQVTVKSIQEKEYLLRFCCGMSVNAAASILQHVNGLHEELQTPEYLWIQNFTLVLVFEAQSPNLLAAVGSRLTLKYKEDFPAMEYYLQRFSNPVQLERLNIHLTLITDQSIARKILEGVTVDSLYFHVELSDQLKDQLSDLTTTISKMPRRAKVTRLYVTSDRQRDGKSNTGESGEEMDIKNQVNHLCNFIRQQQPQLSAFGIGLDGEILQSRGDFTVLVDALVACKAAYLCIENSSLHGYLHELPPLFEGLTSMVFRCCGLTDDDLNEVSTSLASSPGRLTCLYLQEGSFSHDAVDRLAQAIENHQTMNLEKLYLVDLGLHATAVTQIVKTYLPDMREFKTGFFIKIE